MYTLDRFARNRYDSAIYKAKLKRNGVKIFYAKQPMPDTPEGIILESVLEGYAEYYSENLARSIKRGLKENALHGIAMGSPVLGYKIGNDRQYEIDPVGAKAVRTIFTMYAEGKSKTQIVNWLNEQGFKTSRGNAFNKNSLSRILRNDKYIGVYRYDDVVLEDAVPPIIDKTLFDKVQATFRHNYTARAKAKAIEDYLLTTKVFCGHCGEPMVGESGTSKTGKVHHYYKCVNRKRKHNCEKKVEKKEWLERTVVEFTVQQVLTDENIEKISTRAMELIEKELQDTSILIGLQERLKETNKRIKNLMSAIEQGIITPTTKERLEELEEERRDLEGQIAREEMKKPLLTKERIMYWLESFKRGDIKDVEYQRRIIDTLVNSVYVYDDGDKGRKLVLTFNISGNNTLTISSSDIERTAPPAQRKPAIHCDCWFFFVYQCFAALSESFAVRKTSRIYDRVTNEVKRYQNSVDNRVLAFIHKWNGLKNADYKKRARVQLDTVSERAVSDLKSTVGVNATGYRHSIDGNALQHIKKRHGKNGETDHSMANENDIARISYVLDNYDEVRPALDKNGKQKYSAVFCNADGSPAPIVLYSKRIDGTYYAAEAIPDAAAHELRVVSAYLAKNKNGNEGGMLNIPQSDPQLTPEVPPRSNVSVENSVPAAGENVNPKIRETLSEGQGAKSAEFGYDEAQTQTRSTDGVLTDDERAMEGLRSEDRTHKVNHDEEVNAKAQERFESDYEGEKADLFGEKQDWDDTDTVLAHKIIVSEVAKARESGSKDAYAEVAKLMKEWDAHGTEAGQALRQRRQN